MAQLTVKVGAEKRLYRVEVYIDGEIEPTTVFGCRDGFGPVLAALEATEGQDDSIWSRAHAAVRGSPSTIAFHLPSGRIVTFGVIIPQQRVAHGPQRLS